MKKLSDAAPRLHNTTNHDAPLAAPIVTHAMDIRDKPDRSYGDI
jgi:hypothetical protein